SFTLACLIGQFRLLNQQQSEFQGALDISEFMRLAKPLERSLAVEFKSRLGDVNATSKSKNSSVCRPRFGETGLRSPVQPLCQSLIRRLVFPVEDSIRPKLNECDQHRSGDECRRVERGTSPCGQHGNKGAG